jgi:hypothetical protein
MASSGSPLYYTYVATVRYSKEVRASLEIGDTLYPYDSGVEVLIPDTTGVVIVKTSLRPDFVGRLLSSCYLSAVEYVTYIAGCVGCCGSCVGEVVERVMGWLASGFCYGRVRVPRSGELGRAFVEAVHAELYKYVREGCPSALSIEIFGKTVCYGPVIHQRHRSTTANYRN